MDAKQKSEKLKELHKIFPRMSQGSAREATEEEIKRADNSGFTHPNLHREARTDINPPEATEESGPRQYMLSIQGTDSYRTVKFDYSKHNEENEIP